MTPDQYQSFKKRHLNRKGQPQKDAFYRAVGFPPNTIRMACVRARQREEADGHIAVRIERCIRDWIAFMEPPIEIHRTDLRHYIEGLGLSMHEVANGMGVSFATLSFACRGGTDTRGTGTSLHDSDGMIHEWARRVVRDIYLHGDTPYPITDDGEEDPFTLVTPPPQEPHSSQEP